MARTRQRFRKISVVKTVNKQKGNPKAKTNATEDKPKAKSSATKDHVIKRKSKGDIEGNSHGSKKQIKQQLINDIKRLALEITDFRSQLSAENAENSE